IETMESLVLPIYHMLLYYFAHWGEGSNKFGEEEMKNDRCQTQTLSLCYNLIASFSSRNESMKKRRSMDGETDFSFYFNEYFGHDDDCNRLVTHYQFYRHRWIV